MYTIDPAYCKFLHEADVRVPIISKGTNIRPFVGVVLDIRGFSYYAPLSSPNEKHKRMKNQLDFIKIDNGNLGVINLNYKFVSQLRTLAQSLFSFLSVSLSIITSFDFRKLRKLPCGVLVINT